MVINFWINIEITCLEFVDCYWLTGLVIYIGLWRSHDVLYWPTNLLNITDDNDSTNIHTYIGIFHSHFYITQFLIWNHNDLNGRVSKNGGKTGILHLCFLCYCMWHVRLCTVLYLTMRTIICKCVYPSKCIERS